MKHISIFSLVLLTILLFVGCGQGGEVIDGGLAKLPVVSVESSSDDGNVAENATDGFSDTRWSAEGEGETITFDFGSRAMVEKVAVVFHNADIRYTKFNIEYSNNGRSWKTAWEGTSKVDIPAIDWFSTNVSFTARYVRFTCNGYDYYDGSKAGSWNSIIDAEFFSSVDGVPSTLKMSEVPSNTVFTEPGFIDANGLEHKIHTPHKVTGKTIDVTEFGAKVKESSHDDSVAIQEAIDSAEPGDEVFLPTGTYDIFQPIVLKSEVNLRGEEGTILLVKPVKENYISGVLLLPGLNDVLLSDFTLTSAFDGNFTTEHATNNPDRDGPKYMIRVTDSSTRKPSYNVTLDNLLIEKYQTMGVRIANSRDVVVRNTTFQNATDLGGGGAGYGVSIQGTGNGRDRIGFSNDSQFNLVENCTFQGPYLRHGALIQYYSHNNLIRNNTFIQTKLDSIDLHGEDEYLNEIAYNTVKDVETGAAIGVGNSGATHDKAGAGNWIHNNTITNCREGVTVILGSADTLIEENTITGSNIINSKGIYLQNAPGTIVKNNTISDNPAIGFWGVLINGDSGTGSDNRGEGVATDVIIEKNLFENISGGMKITAGLNINMKDNTYSNLDAEILDSRTFSYETDLIPSQILDLLNWKINLPFDKAKEIRQPLFKTYVHPEFFFSTDENDGVVFRAPVDADGTDSTTANSKYPRSELREMAYGGQAEARWDTDNGRHVMKITEAITHLPVVKPHVVAGQIHDANDDVVMIRLEETNLYVEAEGEYIGTLDKDYKLGTIFDVEIVAENDMIEVTYNDDVVVKYPVHKTGNYFKAGVYTQSNLSKGDAADAYGEVIIYDLKVTHSGVEETASQTYENAPLPTTPPAATLDSALDTYVYLMKIDGVLTGNSTPMLENDRIMIKTSSGQTTIRIGFLKFDLSGFAERPESAQVNLTTLDSNGTSKISIYGFEEGINDFVTWTDLFTTESRISKDNTDVMDYINHYGTLTGEITVGPKKPEDPVTPEDTYSANVSSFVKNAKSDIITLAFVDLVGVNVNLQLQSEEGMPSHGPTLDVWAKAGASLGSATPTAKEEEKPVDKEAEAAAFAAAAEALNLAVDHVDRALSDLDYGNEDYLKVINGKVILPTEMDNDVKVSWKSLNPEVVSDSGVVTYPANATDVTLVATLTKNEEETSREFFVVIPAAK